MILVENIKEIAKAAFFGYFLILLMTFLLFIFNKNTTAVLILTIFLEVIGLSFCVFSITSNLENFDRRLRTLCYALVFVLLFSLMEVMCISRFEAGSSSGQDTSPISLHSEGSSPSPATNPNPPFDKDEDHVLLQLLAPSEGKVSEKTSSGLRIYSNGDT